MNYLNERRRRRDIIQAIDIDNLSDDELNARLSIFDGLVVEEN